MSIQALSWVLEHSESVGLARLVLIALANHANHETGECWPSVETIGHEARCSRATVFRALKELETLGEVSIVNGKGRGNVNRYRLEKVSPCDKKVSGFAIKGLTAETQNHKEPSITIRSKTSHAETFCKRCDGTGITPDNFVCNHSEPTPQLGRQLRVAQ